MMGLFRNIREDNKMHFMQSEPRQVSLETLPEETIHNIISWLNHTDVLALGSTCKYFHSVTSSIPNFFYRHWVLQLLNLEKEDQNILQSKVCQHDEETDIVDWRQALKQTHLMLRRLAQCKFPGCKYQKYLRWLEGHPTDSQIVLRVLVCVSMFPSSFREMVEETPEDKIVICFTKRSKTLLNWLFNKEGSCETTSSRQPESPKQYFRFKKFKSLVEHVIEDNKRLHLLMAEYTQIMIRSSFAASEFSMWKANEDILQEITYTPFEELQDRIGRMIVALLNLIRLNRRDEDIRFWA